MGEKIIGWILLIVGLLIIGYSLYSSYNVFTGKILPPQIFKQEQNATTLQIGGNQIAEVQIQEMINQELKGMIPANGLTETLNLAAWSLLAFILIFGGGEISTLGIRLLNKA